MQHARHGTAQAARRWRHTGLILMAGSMFAIGACDGSDAGEEIPAIASTDSVVTPATPAPTAAPITDIVAVVTVPDRVPLVGRRVALINMKVQTVTGPNTFWAGPSPDQQLFVVRSAATATGSADTSAAARTVRAGQTVSISGVLQRLPADLSEKRSDWSLSTANEATLTREQVYLDADTVVVSPI